MSRFIGAEQVALIKSRVDMAQLMGEYTALKGWGSKMVGCCVFHQERTPSMNVYLDSCTYHCFGCGAHGDAITLLQEKERVDFGEAIELLARRVGHVIVYKQGEAGAKDVPASDRAACLAAMEFATTCYEHALWRSDEPGAGAARDYLLGRGLSEATCRTFRLGWSVGRGALLAEASAHGHAIEALRAVDLVMDRKDGSSGDRFWQRIMFPICDRFGAPIGFSARLMPAAEAEAKANGSGVGKYINTKGTKLYDKGRVVWNFHRAREAVKAVKAEKDRRVIVQEGPTDVMAAYQAGFPECVAIMGKEMSAEHLRTLGLPVGESGTVYILLDGDAAGTDGARKAAMVSLATGVPVRIARLDGGKDFAALASAEGLQTA
jgi:DNA primase